MFADGPHQVKASSKPRLKGYAPDAIYEEGEYQNNRRVGSWKLYYPNGKVKSEITYTNGRKNGPYTLYAEDGTVLEKGNWARNRHKGEYALNYADGTPRQRFAYNDAGKREGLQKYFYEDGTPMIEISFNNGVKNGEMVRYWPNGEVKMRAQFNNGTIDESSVKYYEPSENIAQEPPPPPDPPKLPKVLYGDYNPNGYSILYNSDKQPVQVGEFKSGRLYAGKAYNYDENGLLIDVDVYKEGRYVGKAARSEEQ